MKHGHTVFLLVLFYILSICIRLPNLNRPLSKHHEFNTAVILIGLESWKQGGGAEKFNFVPLMNYQNAADKLLEKGPYIDSAGNVTYLSIGPGWYVIPYLAFDTFNIPFTPLALQVLNLFFLALSLITLYRFVYYLSVKAGYSSTGPSIGACFVFLFNPSILWFMGNGYVCTGIVLPFLITILHNGIRMLYEPREIKIATISIFLLAVVCSIYIDWYGVSFAGTIGIAALLRVRSDKRYWIVFGVTSCAIVLGISIILLQFASYAGWQAVFDYWTSRYLQRGAANPDINHGAYILKIIKHLLTSFLPVIIAEVAGFIIIRKKLVAGTIAQPIQMATKISLMACLLNSFIFLNWTGEHNFSVIPYSIFLSLLAAIWIIHSTDAKHLTRLALLLLFITVIQYYYINVPGRHTAKGLPYNSYQQTGSLIRKITSSDERIFCNNNYVIFQYYAGRNFTIVKSYEAALSWARRHQVPKGVWIKINETPNQIHIEEVRHFK